MAKDNREITRGIRIGRTVYRPDQEDDLEKAITEDQGKRLMERGAIAGNFKPAGKAEKSAK